MHARQGSCQLRYILNHLRGASQGYQGLPGPPTTLVSPAEPEPRLTTRCLGLARDTSISSAPELSLGEPDRKSIVSSSCLLSPSATVWMAVVHSSLRGSSEASGASRGCAMAFTYRSPGRPALKPQAATQSLVCVHSGLSEDLKELGTLMLLPAFRHPHHTRRASLVLQDGLSRGLWLSNDHGPEQGA